MGATYEYVLNARAAAAGWPRYTGLGALTKRGFSSERMGLLPSDPRVSSFDALLIQSIKSYLQISNTYFEFGIEPQRKALLINVLSLSLFLSFPIPFRPSTE